MAMGVDVAMGNAVIRGNGIAVLVGDDVAMGNAVVRGDGIAVGDDVAMGNAVVVAMGNAVVRGDGIAVGDDVAIGNAVIRGSGIAVGVGAGDTVSEEEGGGVWRDNCGLAVVEGGREVENGIRRLSLEVEVLVSVTEDTSAVVKGDGETVSASPKPLSPEPLSPKPLIA